MKSIATRAGVTALMCGPGSLIERLTDEDRGAANPVGMRGQGRADARSSSRPTRRKREKPSGISNPARHSASQRAAVKALRSVESSGGSHSVRSITPHARSRREPPHGPEEVADAPSRPAARPERREFARGRSRRCRSRARSRRNGRHGRARGRSPARCPSRRTSPMVTTSCPRRPRRSCIARLLAKLASPTCAMFCPGRPSSISARTGLPLLEALVEVAHVEMRVERDQPDLVERHPPSAEHRRAGDRIVAAGEQGQRMRLGARRDRVADRGVACSMVEPSSSTSPRSRTGVNSSRPVSTS